MAEHGGPTSAQRAGEGRADGLQDTGVRSRWRTSRRDGGAAFAPTLLAVVALAMLASPARASDETAPSSPFGEIVDVRVVNLEVVVTDRFGRRVEGLGPDAFRLLVDGNEVPIEFFTAVSDGVALGDPGSAPPIDTATFRDDPTTDAAPPAPPPKPSPAAAIPPGRVPTSWLVFLDDLSTLPLDRQQLIASFEAKLALAPGDQLAIVRFDGGGIDVLTDWTSSPERIADAFQRARLAFNRGLQTRQLNAELHDETPGFRSGADSFGAEFGGGSPEETDRYRRIHERIERTLRAAAATLRTFTEAPGRKVMLLASGGWIFEPPPQVYLASGKSEVLFGGPWGAELYRPLADQANRLGWTLYPVDAPGFRPTFSGLAVDVMGGGLPERISEIPLGFGGDGVGPREQEQHVTLRYLADQTGGEALVNSFSRVAFPRVASDLASYYWLGFSAPRAQDGVAHEIEIRMRDRSLRARSRKGFVDLTAAAAESMRAEASLLFGQREPLPPLRVWLGALRHAGHRRVDVPLRVAVPLDAVTLFPDGDRWVARFELRIAARDDRGHLAPIPVLEIDMTVETAPAAGGWAEYETTLRLRQRPHEMLVTLHDPITGATRGALVRTGS